MTKKRYVNMNIRGIPRKTLKQTNVTGKRLATDIQIYYKRMAEKHNTPILSFDENTLIDTAQALLNTYIVKHRWLDIVDVNMNPSGEYIYDGGKDRIEKAMKIEIANPTKRPMFLWLRRKWWKWKHNRGRKQ